MKGTWIGFATILVGISSSAFARDVTCPSQDFGQFYQVVRSVPTLQNQFIQFPILHKETDITDGKTTVKATYANLSQLKSAKRDVFPSDNEMKTKNLGIRIKSKGSEFIAAVFVNDTDAMDEYVFKKIRGCFYLSEIRAY